ncbi:MAG: hypothetical protein ACRDZ5_06455 [Acidimicrobiales bacterium]
MLRNAARLTGAGALVIGGLLIALPGAASAAPPSPTGTATTCSTTLCIAGGQDDHSDGVASYTTDETNQTVTITLSPNAGLSFTSGFVCIGGATSPTTSYFTTGTGFTGRPNHSNCPPGGTTGEFVGEQFTGGGPWTVTGVPASWFSSGMFLSIHVSVSNGDTGFPCFVSGSPWYGNCSSVPSTKVPLGTIGGIGLAVVAGGLLATAQLRRRRRALKLMPASTP